MPKTIEQEVRALLKAIRAEQVPPATPYEPNVKCDSPVCRSLGRLEEMVRQTNGKRLT